MTKLVYVLSVVILLGSCSKAVEVESVAGDPVICIDDICVDGEWKWIESSGSIAGITITPETEMQTRKLIIDDTDYSEFVDGELVLETTYEYVKSDELSAFTLDSLILKLDSGNWYAVFDEDSNLVLTEPCADCWTHIYERQ